MKKMWRDVPGALCGFEMAESRVMHHHEVVILRPITTPDFMTARFAELPHNLVRDIAGEIPDLPGVAAVGYDITHKPLGTVEWE